VSIQNSRASCAKLCDRAGYDVRRIIASMKKVGAIPWRLFLLPDPFDSDSMLLLAPLRYAVGI